jgi:uncharacterized glyoxalase superfamily metalloenzyme YdcJ
MYRTEVPLYGQLVDIVRTVDASVLTSRGQTPSDLAPRHELERHGAIRLGTEHEMRMITRLFALLGMHPVGYYDLSLVGFPLHGTAFRPTTPSSLHTNPFRVFTTLLRPDLLSSPTIRATAAALLTTRTLLPPPLTTLINLASSPTTLHKLTAADATTLITLSLQNIFHFPSHSPVPLETYLTLQHAHPMLADIVCFPSAHLNHLTPRTLDIDAVQAAMVGEGLPAKECIEGPPGGRRCEILLRQTSFRARGERVVFGGGEGNKGDGEGGVDGTHTARFGEVEQRGAAVTRKGRELYDRLLAEAVEVYGGGGCGGKGFDEVLGEVFRGYPDDWAELRVGGLVFFRYRVVDSKPVVERKGEVEAILDEARASRSPVPMELLLKAGVVECEPITYEDFLPLSAAGIFTSNLGGGDETTERKPQKPKQKDSRAELERVLGCTIPSEIDLYEELQASSVRECEKALGLREIVLPA